VRWPGNMAQLAGSPQPPWALLTNRCCAVQEGPGMARRRRQRPGFLELSNELRLHIVQRLAFADRCAHTVRA